MRLKERDRRKQFAREYGLISSSAAQAAATAVASLPGAKLAKPNLKSPQIKKEKEKKLTKEDRCVGYDNIIVNV